MLLKIWNYVGDTFHCYIYIYIYVSRSCISAFCSDVCLKHVTHGVTFWHSNWLCLPVKPKGCWTSSFHHQKEFDLQSPSGGPTYCRSYISRLLSCDCHCTDDSVSLDLMLCRCISWPIFQWTVALSASTVEQYTPPNTATSIPRDLKLQQHRCEKLKSRIIAVRPCNHNLLSWTLQVFV
jgi:hypothetical protein